MEAETSLNLSWNFWPRKTQQVFSLRVQKKEKLKVIFLIGQHIKKLEPITNTLIL